MKNMKKNIGGDRKALPNFIVFSIWCVRLHSRMPAHLPLAWCLARTISVNVTYYLWNWNEENARKMKNIKLNGWSFDSWPFLVWMLYFSVRVQYKGKVWTEYYNQFSIYQTFSEKHGKTTWVVQRHIQNPAKHPKWSVFCENRQRLKDVNFFLKTFHLRRST